MAINSLLPETFNKLIERDQTGPVTPTLEDSAGVLRSQLQMITAGLVSFRKQLETARGTDVTRLKERIATYQATQSRLAPKLAELDLQIEAQRYIDGTCNSQDETAADDVLAKYDREDLGAELTFSTDSRFSHTMSRFDLVFFKLDGVVVRYTELTPEQQTEANKIYPVTFEARQAAQS
jgi:hypothetical protein